MHESAKEASKAQSRYIAQIWTVLQNPGWAEAIAPWLTSQCPECGREPAPGDRHHLLIGPYVVVGCEGCHTINPVALGLQDASISRWEDWRNTL